MKYLKDLLSFPEDQLYICNDEEAIAKFLLDGPFLCGCRQWIGGGLVRIYLKSPKVSREIGTQDSYQFDYIVPIRSLTPTEGTWQFLEINW